MPHQILIADDDPVQRRLLEAMVRRFGYETILVDSGDKALQAMAAGDPKIDLVILDLIMPDLDGMGVLSRMREKGIEIPAIVQTAHGSIETVISAMRAGAVDFVVKPVGAERLQISIKNALRVDALETEVRRMSRRAMGAMTFKDIVTRSPEMERVIRLGERAAKSSIPVLIEGESGVGKEVVARAIQGASDRKGKPFVVVNCGAIPENLVESVLFGHEKGAFTDAREARPGLFEMADGGTIFLDEVSETPLEFQAKLLTVLEHGTFRRVGGSRERRVRVRVIAASNQNLEQRVQQGAFRRDLLYRLNAFQVKIPPLRDRGDDVLLIAEAMIDRLSRRYGRGGRHLSAAAQSAVRSHPWHGNVRELVNAVQRAVMLCDDAVIGPEDLGIVEGVHEAAFTGYVPTLPLTSLRSGSNGSHGSNGLNGSGRAGINGSAGSAGLSFDFEHGLHKAADVEKELIMQALRYTRGNVSRAAKLIAMQRSSLRYRIDRYGLEQYVVEVANR